MELATNHIYFGEMLITIIFKERTAKTFRIMGIKFFQVHSMSFFLTSKVSEASD